MKFIQKFLFLLLFLSSSLAFGQLTEDPEERRNAGKEPDRARTPEGDPLPFNKRLRVGGGISGLQIGNPFSIGISPVVAYNATNRLIVGLRGNYYYSRYRIGAQNSPNVQKITLNQYGGSLFGMYEILPSVIPNLFAHVEIDNTSVQAADNLGNRTPRQSLTAPLLGATYMQPISRRFGINLTVLYNVNYNANPILSQQVYGGSPFIIRLGFF